MGLCTQTLREEMTGKLRKGQYIGQVEKIYQLVLANGMMNYNDLQEAMRITRSTIRGRVSEMKKEGLIMQNADNQFLISHKVEHY